MVLTAEQKKENRRLTTKRYREKNKEKCKESQKKCYENNKEKYTERQKKQQKIYYQTEQGKKTKTKKDWKYIGLKWKDETEFNYIYDRYVKSLKCENCNKEYTKDNKKCMDHCHQSNLFRNVLCNSCNANDNSKNSSGVPNISYHKNSKKWRYIRTFNKKTTTKYFNYFIQAVIFKREYEESL